MLIYTDTKIHGSMKNGNKLRAKIMGIYGKEDLLDREYRDAIFNSIKKKHIDKRKVFLQPGKLLELLALLAHIGFRSSLYATLIGATIGATIAAILVLAIPVIAISVIGGIITALTIALNNKVGITVGVILLLLAAVVAVTAIAAGYLALNFLILTPLSFIERSLVSVLNCFTSPINTLVIPFLDYCSNNFSSWRTAWKPTLLIVTSLVIFGGLLSLVILSGGLVSLPAALAFLTPVLHVMAGGIGMLAAKFVLGGAMALLTPIIMHVAHQDLLKLKNIPIEMSVTLGKSWLAVENLAHRRAAKKNGGEQPKPLTSEWLPKLLQPRGKNNKENAIIDANKTGTDKPAQLNDGTYNRWLFNAPTKVTLVSAGERATLSTGRSLLDGAARTVGLHPGRFFYPKEITLAGTALKLEKLSSKNRSATDEAKKSLLDNIDQSNNDSIGLDSIL